MNAAIKMILDVDTGIDDVLAILLALQSDAVELLGVTTAAGNVTAEQATLNTRQVLELIGAPVRVYQGALKPLAREWVGTASDIHGANGIGDYRLPAPTAVDPGLSASEFIVRAVNGLPHAVTLVCVGRLTNLALALEQDPAIASRIKQLVIMGGAVRVPGNVTAKAEANIYGDPEAADRVFRSGIRVNVIGLDVTMKALFQEAHLRKLLDGAPPAKKELFAFIEHIIRFRFEAYKRKKGITGTALHDPLAVASVIHPALVDTESLHIRIGTDESEELGATIEDGETSRKQPNANVAVDVDIEAFIDMFIANLTKQ